MKTLSVRKLAFSAAVAAVYAALTMCLAPISYGAVQFRISEALCILPFFFPYTTWGLYVGCLIANLLSPVGILDIVFGSLATLLAGLATAALGKRSRSSWLCCIWACFMPVIFNAVIVGALIAAAGGSSLFSQAGAALFAVNALEIGLGELAVMFVIGLPLMRILPGKGFFKNISKKINGEDS